MTPISSYLIDSDVLITAKNSYYAFGICPGFWDSLLHGHSRGHLHSIDRVKKELLSGKEDKDLVQWVKKLPGDFFLTSEDDGIVEAYREVMGWAKNHRQYRDDAKAKFARGADGWLVAHGMATGKTVVTNEQRRPKSRRSIKLPDVCDKVTVTDTFAMVHGLGIKYHYPV